VPTGTTYVAELRDGAVTSFEITPEQFGIRRSKVDDLKGGDAEENAKALRSVLDGKPSAFADAALMTAAAGLLVAGTVPDFGAGLAKAAEAVTSGRARESLDRLVRVSNS
jgi:anthranilate phosphoribosyltransferase